MARIIAITGVSSGLGQTLKDKIEERGDQVIGVDREGAEISADLGKQAGRKHAIREILDRSQRLDGLVVAAGVGPYQQAPEITRVNFFGSTELLDGLRPALEGGDAGAAVAIASIGGFFLANCVDALMDGCDGEDEEVAVAACQGVNGSQAYSSVKRAIIRAVRRRSAEWGAAGVRLNVVAPGSMDTPMLDKVLADEGTGPATRAMPIPLGRAGSTDEIAAAVLFLLSPEAAYVHGTSIVVDGGALAGLLPPDQF